MIHRRTPGRPLALSLLVLAMAAVLPGTGRGEDVAGVVRPPDPCGNKALLSSLRRLAAAREGEGAPPSLRQGEYLALIRDQAFRPMHANFRQEESRWVLANGAALEDRLQNFEPFDDERMYAFVLGRTTVKEVDNKAVLERTRPVAELVRGVLQIESTVVVQLPLSANLRLTPAEARLIGLSQELIEQSPATLETIVHVLFIPCGADIIAENAKAKTAVSIAVPAPAQAPAPVVRVSSECKAFIRPEQAESRSVFVAGGGVGDGVRNYFQLLEQRGLLDGVESIVVEFFDHELMEEIPLKLGKGLKIWKPREDVIADAVADPRLRRRADVVTDFRKVPEYADVVCPEPRP